MTQQNINTGTERRTTTQWYKSIWVWLVLSPLFMVMIAMLAIMVPLAIQSDDGAIFDTFHKDGKAYIAETHQDTQARHLGLSASLKQQKQHLILELKGKVTDQPLVLHLIFPTRQNKDQQLILSPKGNGLYVSNTLPIISGRYYLQLKPANSPRWRLHGDTSFPIPDTIELKPRD